MGLIGLANWDGMLRFFNQEAFGATDPIFNLDIGFFVFSLPIWHFVRFWLLLLVVASAIAVTLYYLYRGAVTIEERGIQIRSYARNHVCVLGAIVFLLMAWGYRLDMYRLLFSESGFAFGAGYTDLHARMYALWILLFVAVGCAGLFLMTLRSQRRNLPFIAIGGMIASSLVVGSVYPGLVQYFLVAPNEYDREAPYIQHSINLHAAGVRTGQRRRGALPDPGEPHVGRHPVQHHDHQQPEDPGQASAAPHVPAAPGDTDPTTISPTWTRTVT